MSPASSQLKPVSDGTPDLFKKIVILQEKKIKCRKFPGFMGL